MLVPKIMGKQYHGTNITTLKQTCI